MLSAGMMIVTYTPIVALTDSTVQYIESYKNARHFAHIYYLSIF